MDDTTIPRGELHDLIRSVLREVLSNEACPEGANDGEMAERIEAALSGNGPTILDYKPEGEYCLTEFAQELLQCADDPNVRQAVMDGAIKFRLINVQRRLQDEKPADTSDCGDETGCHWEKGVLTETKLMQLAKSCREVTLGNKAFLTPLAKDWARENNVQLKRLGR